MDDRVVRPCCSCIVLGLPRAGTSLVCNLLEQTGVAGRPNEYLWQNEKGQHFSEWRAADDQHYLNRVLRFGTTPNGVFGVKVMWTYLGDALRFLRRATGMAGGEDAAVLERAFPAPKYVSVRRRDILGQAVSWSKAIQTDEWYAGDPRRRADPPAFDIEQIEDLISTARRSERSGEQWFAQQGIEPFAVGYEDLVADLDGTTRRLLDFLGLRPPDGRIEPTLLRQADALNAEWVERYTEEKGPLPSQSDES